jgi:hypothetical protein
MTEPVSPAADLGVLDVLAFVAELGMFVELAVGGWQLADEAALSVLLAVLLPCVAAGVWGVWCAPRAARRLSRLPRWAVEVTLFTVSFALVINASPQPGWAVFGLATWLLFVVSLPADRGR